MRRMLFGGVNCLLPSACRISGAKCLAWEKSLTLLTIVFLCLAGRKRLTKRKKMDPHLICKYCGKTFLRARGFRRFREHEQRHIGERETRICKYCGKIYGSESGLEKHERRHTGSEPYKCEICGFGLFSRYHYKRHMDSHTGIKNFECSRCGKKFLNEKELKRHQAHEDDNLNFKCDQCSRTYENRRALKDHMHIHSGQKAASVCKFCPKAYYWVRDLNRHMKKVHPSVKADTF